MHATTTPAGVVVALTLDDGTVISAAEAAALLAIGRAALAEAAARVAAAEADAPQRGPGRPPKSKG